MWGKSAPDNATPKPAPAKSSGMDMMIQTLLKSMGVTPAMLTGYIEDGKRLASEFVGAMVSVDKRLAEMQAEQKAQRAILEDIRNATATAPGVDQLYPPESPYEWKCETCHRLYPEYANGCPACWSNGERRSKVVNIKPQNEVTECATLKQ